MSENNENNIQRFGRGNQKKKLQKPKSLFPVDEADALDDAMPENPILPLGKSEKSAKKEVSKPKKAKPKAKKPSPPKAVPIPEKVDFDFNSLNLPDNDAEAIEMLSSLRDEVKAPVITPQEERYPPIAPTNHPKKAKAQKAGAPPQNRVKNVFYNLLTFIFLLATCGLIYWFFQVWEDPQSALNPLAPPTPFVVITAESNTDTALEVQATPDESGQIFVVITDTPMPTTSATESPFAFITQPVFYASNSNDLGCNWWSIAGTVTDLEGNPLTGYRVRIIGEEVSETVFSGASQAFGAGGYELPLIGTPREASFSIQLLSAEEAPLSEEIFIATRADCEANVTLVNFIQNR